MRRRDVWPKSTCLGTPGTLLRVMILGQALAWAVPAAADWFGPNTMLTGVGQTTGSGSEDMEVFGRGFGDMLVTDLVRLLNDNPRFRDCDMAVLEWRRRGDLVKEHELQHSGAVDPKSISMHTMPPEPTSLIEGSVTESGGSTAWTIAMRDRASGEALATSEGSVPTDQIIDISARVAQEILEAVCKPARFSVKAQIDDLVIDTVVCDISGPFQIVSLPGGASATISFTPTAARKGTYSYAGQVAGIPASGSGVYTIDLDREGNGKLVINGVFSVKSPMGTFSKTGPETMTLSPPGAACG